MRIFRTVVFSLLPVLGLASTEALGAEGFSLKMANPGAEQTDSTYNTADHESGIFVLEFFQGHCGPCKKNVPNVKALAKDYEGEDRVQILDIGIDKSPVKYKQWVKKFKPDYPVLMDLKRTVWDEFGSESTPTTVVLDCNMNELFRSKTVWTDTVDGVENGEVIADKIRQIIDQQLATECVAD